VQVITYWLLRRLAKPSCGRAGGFRPLSSQQSRLYPHPSSSGDARGCPCPHRRVGLGWFLARRDGALGVVWGGNILPESWGDARRAQDGTVGVFFFFPPFGSGSLFQFSKYRCNSLENWKGKVGRQQPQSYLNRTLNPKWFINKINNSSRVLGWEISPVFGFCSMTEGDLGEEQPIVQVLLCLHLGGSSGAGCGPPQPSLPPHTPPHFALVLNSDFYSQ